jgi:hypothetical protein
MRNGSDKYCREKDTFSVNRAVYEMKKYGKSKKAIDGIIIRRRKDAIYMLDF